ncbi:MAG: glycosyltransferase family 4 protein [Chloroflexi bacterium]|nr:glycosyltransferase family 4 protein [Chloroflexota bacterium]
MRILAIAPTGFFADYGCHVRICGHLQGLQTLGHRLQLLTYPAGRDIPTIPTRRVPLPGARTMPVGSSWRKLLLDALLLPTVWAAALRLRPQAIYAFLHEGALLGWQISRALHIPLLFDYQGSLSAEMLDHRFIAAQSPLLPWLQRLEVWIEHQPQALFPSSQTTGDLLRQRGISPQRLHLLPDSVDPERFRPRPPDSALMADLGLEARRPVLVYLGLLAPYQGVDMLLQAMADPALAPTGAQLLMMGFPRVEHYRRLAQQLGVGERVRFTGAIPYSSTPRYLALGDVAIAPKLSATEGSGKLLPYMSMALPVVATDTPVHRQYLGDNGLYAAQATAPALAQAIRLSLDQLTEQRQQARLLRKRVQQHYTWQHAARQLDQVLQGLVKAQAP